MTLTAVEKRPPKQVQVNYKTPDYKAEYDDFFARLNWYVMCNTTPSAACQLGFVSVLRNLLLRVCFLLPMARLVSWLRLITAQHFCSLLKLCLQVRSAKADAP